MICPCQRCGIVYFILLSQRLLKTYQEFTFNVGHSDASEGVV
jgi:hypothetical protein